MRRRLLANIVLFTLSLIPAFGCGPRLPVSHADPSPVADWSDPLSNDPVRREVRGLHVRCNRQVEAVEAEVRAHRRGDAVYLALSIAIATAFAILPLGDSTSVADELAMTGPGGPLAYRCTDQLGDNPSHGGCNPPVIPTVGFDGDGALRTNRPVDDTWQPALRIETINAAIDALDDFLFSRPDPAEWTDEEREVFDELTLALAATCGD